MEDVNGILIVSRMTRWGAKAVRYGVAKKDGATLTVFHVIHGPLGIEGWNLPMPHLDKDYRKLLKKNATATG